MHETMEMIVRLQSVGLRVILKDYDQEQALIGAHHLLVAAFAIMA